MRNSKDDCSPARVGDTYETNECLCYRLTIRKCTNGRLKVNSSFVEFSVIRGILKKRSLLISIRTVNITAIQSLFTRNRRDMVFIRKITQLCNITMESVKLVTVANTLRALIILEIMQRTIKNATNDKLYCKNNIEIVPKPTSRIHQTP
jgi:hypothetical protein